MEERKALITTSTRPSGLLRLALHPRQVRFDDSLRGLRLLGEKQTEPRAATSARTKKKASPRKTKGSDELLKNQAKAKAYLLKMLDRVRALGVQVPAASELRRS